MVIAPRIGYWVLLLFGCGILDGDCTSQADPMIVAAVRDARTGRVLVDGVTLVAFNRLGRDSVTMPEGSVAAGATTVTLVEGRLSGGVYTVEVRRAGYATWRRGSVTVREEGHCGHTIATAISAGLQPLLP